jgi:hypothetical protein
MDPPGPVSGVPREIIQPASASQAFVTPEKSQHPLACTARTAPAHRLVTRRPPLGPKGSSAGGGSVWEPAMPAMPLPLPRHRR